MIMNQEETEIIDNLILFFLIAIKSTAKDKTKAIIAKQPTEYEKYNSVK